MIRFLKRGIPYFIAIFIVVCLGIAMECGIVEAPEKTQEERKESIEYPTQVRV